MDRWNDLRERLERAVDALEAERETQGGGPLNEARLGGKIEMGHLALDYMRGYPDDDDDPDGLIGSLRRERAGHLEAASCHRAKGRPLMAERAERRAAERLDDIELARFRPGRAVVLRDGTVYGGLPKPTGRVVCLTDSGRVQVHWGLEVDDHDHKDLELINEPRP